MTQPLIEIAGLVKRFGPFTAVDGLSFSVAQGEVLGFLGPNGAGKSTTMKMITGFLAPSAGSVRIMGLDIVEDRIEAQKRIGYLPEGAPAYADMTPRQFLRFIAEARGFRGDQAEERVAAAVERTQLDGVLDQRIETLSKGFKRRVGLAQAILHDPQVLIMDEPTDGLDPNQKFAVRRLIAEMARDKAIIISTHILEEVEAVCTRALIIDRGRIVADGTPEDLNARSRYHNAVSLDIAEGDAAAAAKAIRAIKGIETLEEVDAGEGVRRLTVYPADTDTRLIDPVAALVAKNKWDVRALYAEKGRLDEVFRTLTTADAQGASSEKGAAA